LNGERLASTPSTASPPNELKDGDILQIGQDYRPGIDMELGLGKQRKCFVARVSIEHKHKVAAIDCQPLCVNALEKGVPDTKDLSLTKRLELRGWSEKDVKLLMLTMTKRIFAHSKGSDDTATVVGGIVKSSDLPINTTTNELTGHSFLTKATRLTFLSVLRRILYL